MNTEALLLENFTSPQQEAVTHLDGPMLVPAGPGSGKTRVITHRVAYLIEQGVARWQILYQQGRRGDAPSADGNADTARDDGLHLPHPSGAFAARVFSPG